MPVIRTFACDDCGVVFEVTQNMDEAPPPCPQCEITAEWRPQSFNIVGTKAKAVDVTQQILEQDFGLTNFRDNQREGDVAAIAKPEPSQAAKDAEIRQLSEVVQQTTGTPMTEQQTAAAQQFWGGGAVSKALPAESLLAGARASTAQANAEGVNPIQLLHAAGKKGHLKTPVRVVARAKM